MTKTKWVICLAVGLAAAWWLQPVKIGAVHTTNSAHTRVLVEYFPPFHWWQVAWFKSNQARLAKEYGIPVKNTDGSWTIQFMGWDGHYLERSPYDQDSDRLCFDDMPTKVNCIDKDPQLRVGYTYDGRLFYD